MHLRNVKNEAVKKTLPMLLSTDEEEKQVLSECQRSHIVKLNTLSEDSHFSDQHSVGTKLFLIY